MPESEAPSAESVEDKVLEALLATSLIPPPTPQEHAKRRRGQEEDEVKSRIKERGEMEARRRASINDEKARQINVGESAAGASSSQKCGDCGRN